MTYVIQKKKSPTEITTKEQFSNASGLIRFITFNVNGVRTLFQYQPFSTMRDSLSLVFDYFDADIITFQELKIEKSTVAKWGKVEGFYSFISIPVTKKGYSGVGCWIREYPVGHPLHHALKVVKAEEGITGYLSIKLDKNTTVRYRDDPSVGIGGYNDVLSEDEALEIDSQGRCVMVELACNIVVISTYCPANSTRTEEGELYRMKFLRTLFGRIRNLEKGGKRVVLMGDLNICRDLMDSAELLDQLGIKTSNGIKGTSIDTQHSMECQNFILNPDAPHRRILNQLLTDSLVEECSKDGILIDSTRYIQGRDRLKMYTVWNTQKNTRPSNYGSRVDFILISDTCKDQVYDANILPDVMGSDHCPMLTDMIITDKDTKLTPSNLVKTPKFEARYRYDLLNHNILAMFSQSSTKKRNFSTLSSSQPPSRGITRKRPAIKSNSIDSFFTSSKNVHPKKENNLASGLIRNKSMHIEATELQEPKYSKVKPTKQSLLFENTLGKAPLCHHGEETVLKTSRTSMNPGKKFWACNRSRGSSDDKDASCGFFKWI